MFDIKDIQFLLKLMDAATVKGLDASEALVRIAQKLTDEQKRLAKDALEALRTQPPGAPKVSEDDD